MKQTKFNNGDSVRLKKNLKVGNAYAGFELLKGMYFDGLRSIDEVTNVSCRVGIYYYPFEMLTKQP